MNSDEEWLEYKKQFPITIERALGAHGQFFTAAMNHPLVKRSGAKMAKPNLEIELNNFAKDVFTAGYLRGLTQKKVEELKETNEVDSSTQRSENPPQQPNPNSTTT